MGAGEGLMEPGGGAGLGALAEALEGVVLIREADGRVLYANHAMELRGGVGTGELVGQAAAELGIRPDAAELGRVGMWCGALGPEHPGDRVTVVEFEHPDLGRLWLGVLHPALDEPAGWEVVIEAELGAAREHDRPLAVGVVGLDGEGDPALAMAAWRASIRAQDSISWLTDDTAVFCLPGCQMEGASVRVQRLLDATPGPATASAGLAFWDGEEQMRELVDRSEETLRQAQAGGQGQLAFAPRRASG